MTNWCITYLKESFGAKEKKRKIGRTTVIILYGKNIVGFHLFLQKTS
ncbi:MAG: hypothetical protein LBH96_00435 [Candidatus Peribacteria bacterium]|jgi:hypothetical protein|nr:hypothetical protein [Candidatus Peribacteria bacterium]